MRRLRSVWAVAGFFALLAPPARADLLRASRPGVMCSSAEVLAKLSLPDGSSRSAAPNASPAVQALARNGGCVDFPAGNVVIVLSRRANTSVVRSDTLSGDGVLDTFVVPNIDYVPYVPNDEFSNAIRARCPQKLDGIVAVHSPSHEFTASLPRAAREAIDKAIEDECGGAGPCSSVQRAVQVSKHGLVQQWAAFMCRKP